MKLKNGNKIRIKVTNNSGDRVPRNTYHAEGLNDKIHLAIIEALDNGFKIEFSEVKVKSPFEKYGETLLRELDSLFGNK